MHRIHVGAYPQARIGDGHARRSRPPRDLSHHRRGLGGVDELLGEQRPGRRLVQRARVEPGADQQMVVIAGRPPPARGRRARGPRPRRTSVPRRAPRAADRGATPARRRAAPGGRCRPAPPAATRAARAGAADRRRTARRGAGRRRSAFASKRMRRQDGWGAEDDAPTAPLSGRGAPAARTRTGLGSMKRTSSWITSTSETSRTPRARKKSTRSATRFSGRWLPRRRRRRACRQPLLRALRRRCR